VQGGCPRAPHPGHRGPRDVHAQRWNSPLRQRYSKPPRAAADVEDRTMAVPEQFLVGRIGRPAPPGHLER
jgi:hypothetical protein